MNPLAELIESFLADVLSLRVKKLKAIRLGRASLLPTTEIFRPISSLVLRDIGTCLASIFLVTALQAWQQLVEQRLRLLQIARVEPLRKPAVNRSKQFARLLQLALVAPEARKAHCGAEFPDLLLLTGDAEGALEMLFCFFRIRRGRLERDFPGNAINFGLQPFFLRPFYFVYRVVNATPSIVRLAKFRVSHCQMSQMPRFIKSCSS